MTLKMCAVCPNPAKQRHKAHIFTEEPTMRKLICILLSAMLIFSAVPVFAADNTADPAGEVIIINTTTPSTTWVDQTGGTLVWDSETSTLTFNSFNYDIAKNEGNHGTAFGVKPVCSVILNGTSVITSSAKVTNTVWFKDAAIGGDGKLTVHGPTLEPEDTERLFIISQAPQISAVTGSFTLNSGTLEAIGGTMTCDNRSDIYDFANNSSSYGVFGTGYDKVQINGGHLIAESGTTSGRKYYNESIGVFVGGEFAISGGEVTAYGKTYGVDGALSFPQYSEGVLYAVGEKSGIGCASLDGEIIARGSSELYADKDSVNGILSKTSTSVRLSDDDSGGVTKVFYEYLTGNAPAKTVVAWRNNERKLAITDSGAELSVEADSTASFGLATKNIKAEEIPQIEWINDVPAGITSSFEDEKLVFKTDGNTQRGVYPFKVAFGEGEKRVVSGESVLSVGSYAAKIVCENKPDAYFDTFDEALKNAALSENAGCTLMLFDAVSSDGDITLDGDFTLNINGHDVTCSTLIIQNGAGVFGKGNIPVGKIGKSGRVGGGTYEMLSVTDGKTITDHLIKDTFCMQKDYDNDNDLYWYEVSAVQSMENALVRPVSFKIDPIADVETKVGKDFEFPINLHETPYYEMTWFRIEKAFMINEDGTETQLKASVPQGGFSGYDSENRVNYSVKDATIPYKLYSDTFPGVGVYKVYAVVSTWLGKKNVEHNGNIYTISTEKYITKTEPFEIRVGVSKPGYVFEEDAVDADGNLIMGWNFYQFYTYTGKPQQLVHSFPQVTGGVMMYRFSENDEWTQEIPTATEPGEYTFQCYIKGNEGYTDVPMRDGYAVINSAMLVDDSPENSDNPFKYQKYFVYFSDALAEAKKEENEGKLLRLYYADKNGFELNGDTKLRLGLEYAATVGDISLGGASQLDFEYGTADKINLSDSARLNVSGGTVKNLAATGTDAQITGGTFENITVSGGLVSDLLEDGYALQSSDGTLVNMYTDKVSQSVSVVAHTHDFGDIGTCACGLEKSATDSDNDGFVEISTPEQMQWFAYQINSGKTLNAVLANDIDLDGKNVIIGTESNPFKGVFDGKGKKISNYTLTVSGNKQSLFGVVYGGTVKNFSISGTITVDGAYSHIGGAVGNAKGNAVISGIVSDVNISGSGEAVHVGGVVGSSQGLGGSLLVEKCIYSGTINMPKVWDCMGGILGYANNLVKISYCGFNGSVTGNNQRTKGYHIGGVLGYINNTNFGGLENSYATGFSNGSALIGTVKDCSDSVKNCLYSEGAAPFGGSGAANHKAQAVSEWNSGSAAYILNGGLYNNTYTWCQTIGKDAFPNFTGDAVYRNGKDSFTSEKPSAFIFFDGDTITAEQIEQPCVLIVASYGDGRLIDIKTKNISGNTEVTLDQMNLNRQNSDRVCAMLWQNLETFSPLCKTAQNTIK